MNLFDTNGFQLLVAGEANTVHCFRQEFAITRLSSISAEETLNGRLSGINKARSPRFGLSLPQAHEDFVVALATLQLVEIHVYSAEAEAVFRTFNTKQTRLGTQDCRIAAQAIARGFTVITRNLSDFRAIGAPCVDWSK